MYAAADRFEIGNRPIHYSSPAIGSDGTIYIGSYRNDLFAINPDGTLKWKYETAGGIDSSPMVGSDGTIYVGSNDGNIYAVNPDGTLKWYYNSSGAITSSPIIDNNGVIYFGSYDNSLYAIESGIALGLAESSWPTFGNNSFHTHKSDIPAYTVYGSIIKEGEGFENIQVTLIGNGINRTVTTDSNGKYSFSYVLNGTYTVTPNKEGNSFIPSNIDITVNDADFTTQSITASKYITLLTPNGNENVIGKTQFNITWIPFNVEHIKIDYSADGGLNWSPVDSNISASDGSYPWTIPNISSNQCIVKLTDVSNSSVYDMSDSTFTIERDHEYGIQITSTGISKSSIDWSPDGKWITYVEGGDIWVTSSEGSEPKNLTEDIGYTCYAPCFTPDSKEVSFSLNRLIFDGYGSNDPFTFIYARKIETLEERTIAEMQYFFSGFIEWSPDGHYTATSNENMQEHHLSISDLINNTGYYLNEFFPHLYYMGSDICFSPDGSHIVTTLRSGFSKIYFSTGEIETLETFGSDNPDYSPDGKWILYNTDKLYIYNNETGSNILVFQDDDYIATNGCFSPDGSKISYLHPVNGFTEVFIADFPYYSPVFVNENEIPNEFSLSQNFPNPFNEATTIKYSLPQNSSVTLTIYNITGQAVSVLKNENQKAGNYSITWNAAEMPSGLYFFILSADNFTETRKMLLVK